MLRARARPTAQTPSPKRIGPHTGSPGSGAASTESAPQHKQQMWRQKQTGSGHFSHLRVIEHHGTGRAEGQKPSGPGAPAQGSPHPVRAAKYMRRLQHGCHHVAAWSAAETWARTSALGAELPARRVFPRALSAPRFRGGRGRGGGDPASAGPAPPPPQPNWLSACGNLDSSVGDRGPGTACVPGTQTRPEALRTLQKDPELVCPEHVPLPSLPASQRQTGLAQCGGAGLANEFLREAGGAEELEEGPRADLGALRALGPPVSAPLLALRATRPRRTGGPADPPAGDGVEPHCARPAAEAGGGGASWRLLRAALISDCASAPGRRRRRVGRG